MKSRAFALLALPLAALGLSVALTPACGSSSDAVSCENPTSNQQTCLTCVNSSCASEVSATESGCPGYAACYESCNCGETSCTDKCGADAGDTCQGAVVGLGKCIGTMCASQCATF